MANLFALRDNDPAFLARTEKVLRDIGEFKTVWRPAPGWLAASAPLPEGTPDSDEIRARGFAFAEGRDRLEQSTNDLGWLDRVAEITDHRPDDLDRLPGDFGFIRFRPDGAASIVRSCCGLAPFYLQRRRDGLAVGTLLSYFTRILPDRYRPDPLINVAFADTARFFDGRTFVEGISIQERGSHTRLDVSGRVGSESYWSPIPADDEPIEPDPEHARELRRLLIEVLERDLDPRGRNLLTLSGGNDSSSLGALAAGAVGAEMSSLSFLPETERGRSTELSYIEPLVRRFRIDPAETRVLTPELRAQYARTFSGAPFQVIHPALCELPRIAEERGVRVLFGGEFADEVVGDMARFSDWARTTPPHALLRPARTPFGRRDYRRWAGVRTREALGRPQMPLVDGVGEWVHPDVAAEFGSLYRQMGERSTKIPKPLRGLSVRATCDAWVAMNWEGTTPLGIRRSIPFFTREVQELAFRCHPAELLDGGKKQLLKTALRKDVPAWNLNRPDRGNWGASNRTLDYEGTLSPSMQRMVAPGWYPRLPGPVDIYVGWPLFAAATVCSYLDEREAHVGSGLGDRVCSDAS